MAGTKGGYKASGVSMLRDKPNLSSPRPADFKVPQVKWSGVPLASRLGHAGYRNVVAFGHSGMAGGGTDDVSTHGWGHELASMLGARFQNYAHGGATAIQIEPQGANYQGGQGQVGGGGWGFVIANLSFPHPSKNWAIANTAGPGGQNVSSLYPTIRAAQAYFPFQPPPWLPLLFYGNNDLGILQYSGGSANATRNLNAFLDAMRTIISRTTAAAVFEEADASCTFGTSWGALIGSGFGLLSGQDGRAVPSTSGSDAAHTLTIQVPADLLYGDVVALGFCFNPGATGQVQVAVDGSSTSLPNGGAISFSGRTSLPKLLPEINLGIVYRIPSLSSGKTSIDGVTTNLSNQLTSNTLGATTADIGRPITSNGTSPIPAGTTITNVVGNTITMSNNATSSATGLWLQMGHVITITVTTGATNAYFDYWQVEAGNALTRSPISCIVPSLFKPMNYTVWQTPTVTDADVDAWNDAYKSMIDAEFPGALWVDLANVLPRLDSQPPWFYYDQLHPSTAGHQLIASKCFDAICDQAPKSTGMGIASKAKDLTSDRGSTVWGPGNQSPNQTVTSTSLIDVVDHLSHPFDIWLPAAAGDIVECRARFLADGGAAQVMRGDIAVMGAYAGAPSTNASSLVAGGSLTVGTQYYHWFSGVNAKGETVASGPLPAPLPTTGNQSILLTFYVPSGLTSVKIYRTTSITYPTSGSNLVTTVASPTANANNTFTDTGAALTAGFPPGTSLASGSTLRVISSAFVNNYNTGGSNGLGFAPASTFAELMPVSIAFQVLPSDLQTGGILLRPQVKLDSAGSRILWTAGNPAWFMAINKGRQAIFADRAT